MTMNVGAQMCSQDKKFYDPRIRPEVVEQGYSREHVLEKELETERMRLAACSFVALSNTDESAKEARQMHTDYWSAACDDVARSVDKQMAYRNALLALRQILDTSVNDLLVRFIDSVLYKCP